MCAAVSSNAIVYAKDGQAFGIGAGQQSRVDCTKLAGSKADLWHLRTHPKVLGLEFKKGVKRQERINWRVRYIEGDLTRFETEALQDSLDAVVRRGIPQWLDLEKDAMKGNIKGFPLREDLTMPMQEQLIVELYSK